MQRSMFALAGLAVLAAVTASMFGMLAEGGGKAEAVVTPITITATATGSQTPPVAACPVTNGDFVINSVPVPGSCGDGADEGTNWYFNFTGDPGLLAFRACGPLTSALLTLTLTPIGGLQSNDTVGIGGLGPAPDVPDLVVTTTFPMELLGILAGYTSPAILGALDTTAPAGQIFMGYQDDAIVSFAKLELTKDCQSGPPAVGGVVGLLGDAETPADASGSSSARTGAAPIAAAVAAALVAMAAGGWYVTRRRAR